MSYIEEKIDIKEIFKNGIFEKFLDLGMKLMVIVFPT